MPKCGGISFRSILENQFGSRILLDYKDVPINKSSGVRQWSAEWGRTKNALFGHHRLGEIDCVHGHFMPYKYLPFRNEGQVVFVTWLRDPVDRLASHYYFWQRAYDISRAAPLHRKVIEENWSFEQFCFSDELRNVYTKFLWKFGIERFDFIGITEHFEEDIVEFAKKYIDLKLTEIPQENVNPIGKVDYFKDKEELRNELIKWHAEDYRIYDYAIRAREERLKAK